MEFPARLDSPEGMPYDEKCPRSSHCVGPHYATVLPHWEVSNGEHGEFTWGILENIPGFRSRKKNWKMGVDQVDDHDWGYELTKIIPAMLFQDVLYWKASRPWTLGCSKAPQFILSTVHEFAMVLFMNALRFC